MERMVELESLPAEPGPGTAALPRRRQWLILGAMAAAVVVLICAVWAVQRLLQPNAAAPRQQQVPANTFRPTREQLSALRFTTVEEADFHDEIAADGRLAFNADVATAVYSPFSGRIVQVIAGLGETVKRGAPLYTMEASEFDQTAADLRAAQATWLLARQNEERRRKSYEVQGASLQELQQAQADAATASAAYDAVRGRLHVFGLEERDIDALLSNPAQRPVVPVTAPIDGVVADRQVGPGQFVQAGGNTPAFTVGSLRTLWLVINLRESDATRVRLGQTVTVRVAGDAENSYQAKVISIGASLDPATHRLPVRAALDNSGGQLRPEMFATALINAGQSSRTVAIPDEAVVYDGDQTRVWVLLNNQDLVLRDVHIGRSLGGRLEVRDGLRAGERVLVSGALFIDRAARPD